MRDKSEENWRVGTQCLDDGDLNVAASRIYYATFQAVLAWASAKKEYIYNPRESAHSKMYRYVRSEGKARALYGRVLADMQGLRETADYQPDPPDKEQLKELLPDCKRIQDYYLKMAESP